MTDFYSVLKSIIAESGADSPEGRARLYARAREMLDRQLDSLQPPATDEARRRQHEAFDVAVRRIEVEIASRPEQAAPTGAVGPQQRQGAEEEDMSGPPGGEYDVRAEARVPRRRRGGSMVLAIVLLILIGGGAIAYWQWETVEPPLASLIQEVKVRLGMDTAMAPEAPMQEQAAGDSEPVATMEQQRHVPEPQDSGDASQPTMAENQAAESQGQMPASPPAAGTSGEPAKDEARPPAALATERAYLIVREGKQADTEKRLSGTALWSLGGSGADTSLAVAVSIPEKSAQFSIVIRANTDRSLPASHTIDLIYHTQGDPDGQVTNVPGLMVRTQASESSIPLRGAGAQVVPGQFLFGLSGAPADRAHNLDVLEKAQWLVIPVLFETKNQAVFVIEKGDSGKAAMAKALAAWDAARPPPQTQ